MKNSTGKVFLVGAGPGAPDLITVRGRCCIRTAEVVLHDDLSSSDLLDEAPAEAKRIYVGKRHGKATMEQEQICQLMVNEASEGKRVVRLKGGDPFVFGRGGEEAMALVSAGIPFEVVPGVTSPVAAPAFAGIPITHRDHADGFEVLTGHRPTEHPRMTTVVLMAVKHMAQNVEVLRKRGRPGDTPAAVVQWGTLPRQRTVVATLDTITEAARGLGSPAALVVGSVAGLTERLGWFEQKPLFGKRVLVTRSRHQAAETCRLLEELGAETVTLPTIEIRPPEDLQPLYSAVQALGSYDYIILTSANTVDALARALEHEGLDSRAMAGVTVCAIGPGTARALARLGVTADLVPRDHRAEGILDLLPEELVRGKRVLLPRAAKAREILPDTLRQRGARLDFVVAYVTGLPDEERTEAGLGRLRAGELDVLTFTSASTVENFAAMVGPGLPGLCQGMLVAAIGPVTRDACEKVGLTVDVMPTRYTLPAMTDALVAHLATQKV